MIVDSSHYTHPIRLLSHYFSRHQLLIINAYDELASLQEASLVILLSETKKEKFLSQEGSFFMQTGVYNDLPAVCIQGSDLSGIIYAVNELGQRHLVQDKDGIHLPSLNINQAPGLAHRFFWTWDHSTNWYLEQTGQQEIGFANPYMKPATGFLEDYCRLIDFMSLNRINGVTIYGFLRDSHGGIEAAQELCRYATERGVRIFPGVGINCYGGIYWEGKHPYNLTTWLRKHPELRAQFEPLRYFDLPEFAPLYIPETSYLDTACPSNPKNADYHIEAIQWLAETFQIGGINFETGDYGTCQCNVCKMRRASDQQWSLKDMALIYPRLFSAAQQSRKDLKLICEAYWDNLLDLNALQPLSDLPNEAIYQFCINRNYWNRLKTELSAKHVQSLPRVNNILRTHMGSQWQHERYELVATRYAEMMQLAATTGLQGATIFGEASTFNAVNEINYLAFARFGYDPMLSWEQFVKHDLGSLVGGTDVADQYLRLLVCDNNPRTLKQAIGIAREIAQTQTNDSYRRWLWLQNRLYQKQFVSIVE